MELASQKFRANAPELDPLRIGTGWKKKTLERYRSLFRVLLETAIQDPDIWINW